jgi:hypothetical protein
VLWSKASRSLRLSLTQELSEDQEKTKLFSKNSLWSVALLLCNDRNVLQSILEQDQLQPGDSFSSPRGGRAVSLWGPWKDGLALSIPRKSAFSEGPARILAHRLCTGFHQFAKPEIRRLAGLDP